MSKTYRAKAGDTWDLISFRQYGDEKYVINLIVENPDYMVTVIFDGGELLTIPDIPDTNPETLPPWRR